MAVHGGFLCLAAGFRGVGWGGHASLARVPDFQLAVCPHGDVERHVNNFSPDKNEGCLLYRGPGPWRRRTVSYSI